ncbi:STAS-like domain-containing protein [Enhygromyxa salina]|nr:ATP-binding protein [Enhygromyxa salina]
MFAEPIAVAMLGAWATYQRELGRDIIIDRSLQSPIAFRSGLLSALAGRTKGGSTTSLFFRLCTEQETQDKLGSFVEAILKTTPEAERIAHYCLADLAQNVFDHARTGGQGAFCAVSLDKRTSRVRLAVADCGQGIPATIKPHYEGDLDDLDSLLLALEPELSGNSARDGVNRGVGLYFVRRLALAASGGFCAITEGLSARASARNPSDFTPKFTSLRHRWQGTAVAVTFNAIGSEYSGPMQAIKDEIEGRGPRYADIRFFRKSANAPDWHRVEIKCDRGKFALDRERAIAIAQDQVLPLLRRGVKVELDFTGVAKATQAFCHALIVPLVRGGGDDVLGRLHFVGCSARTRSPICFAVNYATAEDDI